jgi:hypothetical protein
MFPLFERQLTLQPIVRPFEHLAVNSVNEIACRRVSCVEADATIDTGVTKMLAKSEIVLLVLTMVGTAAGLVSQRPSLMGPIYDQPTMACSVSASEFAGVRPSFAEATALQHRLVNLRQTLGAL